MNMKIGRNDPCPCGSGQKYKKCCFRHEKEPLNTNVPLMDKEGIHVVGKGTAPSPEELERMTNEYQKNIKKGPLWKIMVEQYGLDKAEKMLKEFHVQVK